MKKLVVEAYNELMKVKVNGADVEHMYNALARLAAFINAPEEGEANDEEVD